MKVNKSLHYKNKLIELILLNFFFKKSQKIESNTFNDVVVRIKKILHIVYKYHMLNKKILFLGTPIENHFYIESILKQTKHIAVPKDLWVNGLITNKKSCFKNLIKKQTYSKNSSSKILLKLSEPIDLILIINDIKNKAVAKEILNSQIPVIYFNNSGNKNRSSVDFNYTLGLELMSKKTVFNFFFSMIKTILKKTTMRKFKFTSAFKK